MSNAIVGLGTEVWVVAGNGSNAVTVRALETFEGKIVYLEDAPAWSVFEEIEKAEEGRKWISSLSDADWNMFGRPAIDE